MTTRTIAAAATFLAVTALHAQGPPRPQVIDARDVRAAREMPMPPDPPAGAGAWSLRVHTAGGFTGQGVGSITISSDGQLACGPAPCATPIAKPRLDPVSRTLVSIVDSAWIRRPPSSICRDCIETTIVLKRREGDIVRIFVASWDDDQAPAPELRELRRLAFELRDTRRALR